MLNIFVNRLQQQEPTSGSRPLSQTHTSSLQKMHAQGYDFKSNDISQHFTPTVEHGGEGVMIWVCFAATGQLTVHRVNPELFITEQ